MLYRRILSNATWQNLHGYKLDGKNKAVLLRKKLNTEYPNSNTYEKA